MGVEETDSLPWWQKRMYLEEWTEDLERERRAYDAGEGDGEHFWGDERGRPPVPPRPEDFTGRPDYPPLAPDAFREMSARSMPGLPRDRDPDTIEGLEQSFGVTVRRI